MLYEYGKRPGDFGAFFLVQFSFVYFGDVFNETIIPLVGYEMTIANYTICTSVSIFHLISKKRE